MSCFGTWPFTAERLGAPRSHRPRCALGLGAPLVFLGSLAACEPGATGDPCWSDFDCASQSCSFGTCDSELIALIELLGSLVARADAPSDAPPPPAPVVMESWDPLCEAGPGGELPFHCELPIGCFNEPEWWTGRCGACISDPRCPGPCERILYCRQ